jgi:hypothetical protein
MADFGRWKYTVDRAATIEAYAAAERGGVDGCDCGNCRNFRLARQEAFPAAFVRLLDQLGIDPRKDAEVYYIGRDRPGRHRYGGWYHFVGTLHETGDFPLVELAPGFQVFLCRAASPRLASLKNSAAVQVEFIADAVPWLLDEPEPA